MLRRISFWTAPHTSIERMTDHYRNSLANMSGDSFQKTIEELRATAARESSRFDSRPYPECPPRRVEQNGFDNPTLTTCLPFQSINFQRAG